MTNSLMKHSFSMPTPAEMDHLIKFCTVMAESPFYRKLGAGGVMAIYLTAKEHDLPVMSALNGGLYNVDGKVTFSAIMIDALILKAGHKTEVIKLDEDSCKIRFTRCDRSNDPSYSPFEYEYTIKQAEKAGYLKKDNWKNNPKDMLYCRCLTGGGRKHIPEVFVGVLVAGELVGTEADGKIEPLLPALDVKPIQFIPIPDAKPIVNPETASKESVDRLLELVKQTPQERQNNFKKIVESKGWQSEYEMTEKFCETQTANAQLLIAQMQKEKEKENVG